MKTYSALVGPARQQAEEVLAGETIGKNQIYLAETIIGLCDEIENEILPILDEYIEMWLEAMAKVKKASSEDKS